VIEGTIQLRPDDFVLTSTGSLESAIAEKDVLLLLADLSPQVFEGIMKEMMAVDFQAGTTAKDLNDAIAAYADKKEGVVLQSSAHDAGSSAALLEGAAGLSPEQKARWAAELAEMDAETIKSEEGGDDDNDNDDNDDDLGFDQ